MTILLRRRIGVERGLPRRAHDRLQLREPRRQTLAHRCLLHQQGTLLGLTRTESGRERHQYLDLHLDPARNPPRPTR